MSQGEESQQQLPIDREGDRSFDGLLSLIGTTVSDKVKVAALGDLSRLDLDDENVRKIVQAAYRQRAPVVTALVDMLLGVDSPWSVVAVDLLARHGTAEIDAVLDEAEAFLDAQSSSRIELRTAAGHPDDSALSSGAVATLLTLPAEERRIILAAISGSSAGKAALAAALVELDGWLEPEFARKSAPKPGSFLHDVRTALYAVMFLADVELPTVAEDRISNWFFTHEADEDDYQVLAWAPTSRLLPFLERSFKASGDRAEERTWVAAEVLARFRPELAPGFAMQLRTFVAEGSLRLAASAAPALVNSPSVTFADVGVVVTRLRAERDVSEDWLKLARSVSTGAGVSLLEFGRLPEAAQDVVIDSVCSSSGPSKAALLLIRFLRELRNPVGSRRRVIWGLQRLNELLVAPDADEALATPEEALATAAREELWQVIDGYLVSAGRLSAKAEGTGVQVRTQAEDFVADCFSKTIVRQLALARYPDLLAGLPRPVGSIVVQYLLVGGDRAPEDQLFVLLMVVPTDVLPLFEATVVELARNQPEAFASAMSALEGQGRIELVGQCASWVFGALKLTADRRSLLEAQRAEGTGAFANATASTMLPLLRRAKEFAEGNEDLLERYRLIELRLGEEGLLASTDADAINVSMSFAERYLHLPKDQVAVEAYSPPRLRLGGHGILASNVFAGSLVHFEKYAYTPGVLTTRQRSWCEALLQATVERVDAGDLLDQIRALASGRQPSGARGRLVRVLWMEAVPRLEPQALRDFLADGLSDDASTWGGRLLRWTLEVRGEMLAEWNDLTVTRSELGRLGAREFSALSGEVARLQAELDQLHGTLWARVAREIAPVFNHVERVMYGYYQLRQGLAREGWRMVEPQLGRELTDSEVRADEHLVGGHSPSGRYRVRSSGLKIADGLVVEKAILEPLEGGSPNDRRD